MEAVKNIDASHHTLEEQEIIIRILKGEKELYEILVRRNNQKLYRVVRSYLKEDAEIEDVMQDSYVKAFIKLNQFKFESAFSTWLIRIGINEALARLRDKGKIYHLSKPLSTMNYTLLEVPDYKQLNPQDKMIRKETKQLLENAIDSLELKYRTVYILKEIEEMSLKEIATALDLTVANVKVRLHRSKEMLKDKLFEAANDKQLFEFGFSNCDRITENVMKKIKGIK
ncbi:MAG: RNA polymerase sigma factor [Bacteroidetes bacterium]|jgi:RNA polymerase sigma-70 factor (ECF subfamily)|nr:RNA polymerase sigma factor [Bacteroidota bacterium]